MRGCIYKFYIHKDVPTPWFCKYLKLSLFPKGHSALSPNPVTGFSLCTVASVNIHMVKQIRAGLERLLCHNSFNLVHFFVFANLLKVWLSFVICSSKSLWALCAVLGTFGIAVFLHLLWKSWMLPPFIIQLQLPLSEKYLLFSLITPLCCCLATSASFYPFLSPWCTFALWFQYHDLNLYVCQMHWP